MRRVVLGIDAEGKAVPTAEDAPSTVFLMDSVPDAQGHVAPPAPTDHVPHETELPNAAWAVAELWTSDEKTLAAGQADPTIGAGWQAHPGPGATMWRHAVWAPGFSAPIHETHTLDYDTVISGEVYLVHDGGEILLQQGDTAVIPGVRHGWRTTEKGCTLSCVMIGLPGEH